MGLFGDYSKEVADTWKRFGGIEKLVDSFREEQVRMDQRVSKLMDRVGKLEEKIDIELKYIKANIKNEIVAELGVHIGETRALQEILNRLLDRLSEPNKDSNNPK